MDYYQIKDKLIQAIFGLSIAIFDSVCYNNIVVTFDDSKA